jgi:hypothetical protein
MNEPGLPGRHDGLIPGCRRASSEEGKKGIVEGLHPDVQSVDSRARICAAQANPTSAGLTSMVTPASSRCHRSSADGKKCSTAGRGQRGGWPPADIKGVEGADPPPLRRASLNSAFSKRGISETFVTKRSCSNGTWLCRRDVQ